MRKILKNNNKSKRLNGSPEGKIGTILGIKDKNDKYLVVGDRVQYGKYKGILLWNPFSKTYGIALNHSMWYGDDKYNIHSYGNFIEIPMDNGIRMEIEKLQT